MINPSFPDFNFRAVEIIRFAQSDTLFSLLLNDRQTITHYEAGRHEADSFRQWLLAHGITDAKSNLK